jgi:hypothetical protein
LWIQITTGTGTLRMTWSDVQRWVHADRHRIGSRA